MRSDGKDVILYSALHPPALFLDTIIRCIWPRLVPARSGKEWRACPGRVQGMHVGMHMDCWRRTSRVLVYLSEHTVRKETKLCTSHVVGITANLTPYIATFSHNVEQIRKFSQLWATPPEKVNEAHSAAQGRPHKVSLPGAK